MLGYYPIGKNINLFQSDVEETKWNTHKDVRNEVALRDEQSLKVPVIVVIVRSFIIYIVSLKTKKYWVILLNVVH